jgi:IclR family pca regulon transcriptional regulator
MRNTNTKRDRNFVNSLARGFSLLEVFSPDHHSAGITEIATKMGLSKTTVFRITHTLNKIGYLRYDSENQKYYLGPKVLTMGFATLGSMKFREIAKPYMEELSKATGENINLGVLDGHEVIYIEQIKSKQILDVKLYVGSRIPIYNTAIGRAIMAYLPLPQLNEILEKLCQIFGARPFLGLKCKKILKTLDRVRSKGYAVNNEEWETGIRAIGAPILNHNSSLEGGINISVLSAKISLNELESRYAPLLIETAKRISFSLGYCPQS